MISSPHEQLFSLLNSLYPLSEQLKKALLTQTQEISRKKGTCLFKEGMIASNAYFIAKGIGRTFYYNEGKEITHNICPENRIFISAGSYYTGLPSYETGELIEDSELIVLPRDTVENLCLKYLELNYMIRRLVEMFYVILDQRTFFLHMKSAPERYTACLESSPDFFNRVPLGQIASFLGMSQETLSRLRNNAYPAHGNSHHSSGILKGGGREGKEGID